MKHCILFLITLSLSISGKSQTFSQEFINNAALYTNNYSILKMSNKNWAVLTEVDNSNNSRKTITTISTNNNGIIQFANSYATDDTNFSINSNNALSLPNGDVIITGVYNNNNDQPYYPFFMSLNSSGNINWVKQLDIANANGNIYLKQLSDNSILVNLKYIGGVSHQLLFKLDQLGNFTDFYEYNLTAAYVNDILVNNGSFELLLSDGNFINIDNDLQTINWQRKYNQIIGITINKAANGDYLLATAQEAFPGHMTVSRLDSSGTIIWTKYIEAFSISPSFEFDIVGFHFITENSNGDIIVCANSEGGLNGSLFVKLEENGSYISNYKSTSFHNKMTIPTNNSFIYGGFVDFGTFNTSNFVFNELTLTSSLDCDISYDHTIVDSTQTILTPDIFTLSPVSGITSPTLSIVKNPINISQQNYCNSISSSIENNLIENSNITIYPNPANASIKINSKSPIVKVAVYDMSGKLLFENYNKNQVEIDRLDNGIYFLNIHTETQQISKRFIKN